MLDALRPLTLSEIQGGLQAIVRLVESPETNQYRFTDFRESLDYLRVAVKYLKLDVEATRRERDYFKAIVDGK